MFETVCRGKSLQLGHGGATEFKCATISFRHEGTLLFHSGQRLLWSLTMSQTREKVTVAVTSGPILRRR